MHVRLTQQIWDAQILHILKKDLLSSRLALGQLMEDKLWTLRIFFLVKSVVCLRTWTMQYQLDQIIYANSVIYGECLFFPGDLESE